MRIQNKLMVSLVLFLCLWLKTSFAALDIELTQGITDAVPIAVTPFKAPKKIREFDDDIGKIIAADLKNSGRFGVLSNKKNDKAIAHENNVNITEWRRRHVDYVIVGQVSEAENDQYKVHVALVEMYPEVAATDSNNPISAHVALTRDFTISANAFRRVAHRISDDIYHHLTGEPGIFSTRIAYVLMKHRNNKPYQYQLQVADYDGHQAQTLLTSEEPIMSPSWAPDAKRIAYVSFEGERSEVFVQSVATGAREKVASFKGINSAPAWSPDGRKMAVVLSHSGKPKIYVMDLNSKRFTQLTQGLSIDTEPTWMPDGQSILFTSNRGGSPQIYRVSLATKHTERVTYDGRYNASVDVSQDGRTISYLHIDGRKFAIAAQNMETGMVKTLTNTSSGLDESPSISPNGRMIIYATHHGNQGILAMVSVDGRIHLRLPAHDGNVQEPAWSPIVG